MLSRKIQETMVEGKEEEYKFSCLGRVAPKAKSDDHADLRGRMLVLLTSSSPDQGGLDCRRNSVRVCVAKFSILLLDEVNILLTMSV